jgi:hypothetical protein
MALSTAPARHRPAALTQPASVLTVAIRGVTGNGEASQRRGGAVLACVRLLMVVPRVEDDGCRLLIVVLRALPICSASAREGSSDGEQRCRKQWLSRRRCTRTRSPPRQDLRLGSHLIRTRARPGTTTALGFSTCGQNDDLGLEGAMGPGWLRSRREGR